MSLDYYENLESWLRENKEDFENDREIGERILPGVLKANSQGLQCIFRHFLENINKLETAGYSLELEAEMAFDLMYLIQGLMEFSLRLKYPFPALWDACQQPSGIDQRALVWQALARHVHDYKQRKIGALAIPSGSLQ